MDYHKDNPELLALQYYVKEDSKSYREKYGERLNDITVNDRIKSLLQKQTPLEHSITVYRGQKGNETIKANKGSWISTSESIKEAFSFLNSNDKKCCLFKIHVMPGIRVLYVHPTLKKAGLSAKSYEDEKEIIIDDDGDFSSFDETTVNGIRMFETTFSPHKAKENVKEIPKNKTPVNSRTPQELYNSHKGLGEDFEFVESEENLVNQGYLPKSASSEFKKMYWELLQKNKTQGGTRKKRKSKRSKRTKKTKTKK